MERSKRLLSFLVFALLLVNTIASDDQTLNSDDTSRQSSLEGEQIEHWGFPHFWFHPHPFPYHPWPFVHPPMPSKGWPKIPHWPFVHPPMPSKGWPKIPHWPFVHPPMPCKGWPKIPHWPFVHPPMPSKGGIHTARELSEEGKQIENFWRFPHFGFHPHPWPRIPHWPFVHPPMPSKGWPKIPHWPFVHPPMPSKEWPKIPHWPFVHPPIPSWFPHHPHQEQSVEDQNESSIKVEDVSDARCSSTNAIVESCMRKNSFSWSNGHSFDTDCCRAIAGVSDECAHDLIHMIKQQCSNAPSPTA